MRRLLIWLATAILLWAGSVLGAGRANDGPAFQAARHLKRGVNLGNYLEAPIGQNWGAKYSDADFKQIRSEGFDHVRLPVAWHYYAGAAPAYELRPEIYEKVEALIRGATNQGLAIIINIHHFDEFTSNPAGTTKKFYALWEQIARRYAAAGPNLFLELLNEPKDAATTALLGPIYAEAIRRIRLTNPARTILVGPGRWNQVDELPQLVLPADDNLIVTVHCYDPFLFTHQGASWAGPAAATVGVIFPGPPAVRLKVAEAAGQNSNTVKWIERYNSLPSDRNPSSPAAFREKLRRARDWGRDQGRPIHVGEFGCYQAADPISRARFYATFREALDELDLGWAMWDWKAGFKYWDEASGRPAPGLREALFSRKGDGKEARSP